MDTSELRPRKRKQLASPSSRHPSVGILTRSKSHSFLHRHRSGRVRLGTVIGTGIQSHSQMMVRSAAKRKPLTTSEAVDDNSMSHGLIKDLRTRRVFSPDFGIENELLLNSFEKEDRIVKDDVKKNDSGFPRLSEDSIDESADLMAPAAMEINASDTTNVDGNQLCVRFCNENNFDASKKCSVKELPAVEKGEEDTKKNAEDLSGNLSRSDKRVDQRNEMVVSSVGRRKIFKAPSSFSYRRLLPFLGDILRVDPFTGISKVEAADVSCKIYNSHVVNQGEFVIGVYPEERKPLHDCVIKNSNIKLLSGPVGSPHENRSWLYGVDLRSNVDFQQRVNKLTADNIQMTPTDADSKHGENDTVAKKEKQTTQIEHRTQLKPSSRHIGRSEGHNAEAFVHSSCWRNTSISSSKLALNSCSKMKVFRNPSSISYKRLLPFLSEMTKDNTYSPKTDQPQEFQRKLKEKSGQPPSVFVPQKVPANIESEEYSLFEENLTTQEKGDSPTPTSLLNACLPDSCNLGLSLVMSSNSDSGNVEDLVNNTNGTPTTLESGQKGIKDIKNVVPCALEMLRSKSHRESVVQVSQHDLHEPEEGCISLQNSCNKDAEKLIEEVRLVPNQSVTATVSSELRESDMRRGILKKKPRGCRGPCDCLSCASFRLHAERAVEFSRNQMLDAEEVFVDLITELASLRSMLKKYADVGNGDAIIPINQVEEACTRALTAENLAKKTLGRMIEDLKIHCKMTFSRRPRVTFANGIDEQSFPEAESQDYALQKTDK